MRRHLLTLALVVLATPVFADSGLPSVQDFYIKAYGGLRVPDNLDWKGTAQDLGIGTTLGASVGVDTSVSGLAVDLDYTRSSATYSSLGTSLDSQSLMLDAQYAPQLNLGLGISPYAAVGLGGVNVTYKASDGGNAFAYQLKLGATGPVTDQLSWFGEYRYQQALGEVNVGSPAYPVEYASHSILGGLKLSFGGGASAGPGTGSYWSRLVAGASRWRPRSAAQCRGRQSA